MTHSLHRRGNFDSLADEFVILSMSAKGFNEEGSGEKLRQFLDILLDNGPANFGDMQTGNRFVNPEDKIKLNVQDTSIVHGVFNGSAAITGVLKELKERDLGISVVVSGIHDITEGCCRNAGLKKHTVEHSMGIFGRMDRLPGDEYLELTTMCGHGMVPANLLEQVIWDIKKGKKSCEEAGRELARPCHCGIFNPVRAAKLLERLVPKMTFAE